MKMNYHQLMIHGGFQEKTELLGLLRMGLQGINQMTSDDVILTTVLSPTQCYFLGDFCSHFLHSVYHIICTSDNVKSIKRFVCLCVCVRKKNVVKVIILLLVVQAVD